MHAWHGAVRLFHFKEHSTLTTCAWKLWTSVVGSECPEPTAHACGFQACTVRMEHSDSFAPRRGRLLLLKKEKSKPGTSRGVSNFGASPLGARHLVWSASTAPPWGCPCIFPYIFSVRASPEIGKTPTIQFSSA